MKLIARQVETKKDKDKPTEQDDGGSHPLATLLLLNESLAVDRMLKIRLRTWCARGISVAMTVLSQKDDL